MKKVFLRLALVLICIGMNACVYAKVRHPLDTDVENTTLGSKVGRASNQSVLWLVAWGDGGTEAAAKNGDIKVVRHLDTEEFFILFGLYAKVTTIAYGD